MESNASGADRRKSDAFTEIVEWFNHVGIIIPDPEPVVIRWDTTEHVNLEDATDDDLIITPDKPTVEDLAHCVSIVHDCEEQFPGAHNWRRWKLTGRLASFLYVTGITANGGSSEMSGRDPVGGWIRRLPTWTRHRRCYVLWKPMWWWECQWRQRFAFHRHTPLEPFGCGICAACLPCPYCGEPYDCQPDCATLVA